MSKRFFNTTGPCRPDWHYMLPASTRISDARDLIDHRSYFVLHAPRQTGKTTALRALARELVAEGRYAALYFSCEAGEPWADDPRRAQEGVLADIGRRAGIDLPEELRPPADWPPQAPDAALLSTALGAWARVCPRPLVLFFDEIDALRGDSLLSVLCQLRAGFPDRPEGFPAAVVLCGLRDVRDYKAASGGDTQRLGTSSPFNIKVASIRLGDFTCEDVHTLLQQHTEDTGQAFAPEALDRVWELTQGQPWLVNSLARELVGRRGAAGGGTVLAEHVDAAREHLILERQTHLDSLVACLNEDRVRRVLEPLLAGGITWSDDTYDDDVSYVRDLGLLAPRSPARVANPIYREIIVRVLAGYAEDRITVEPRSFVLPDGRLDFRRLLREFADFWIEHGEVLASKRSYHEVAPQLVIMAFMQRVVNGGGTIDREYGVGRGRIDLVVRWPWRDADGQRQWQREAVELKVRAEGRPDPLDKGLVQLDAYLERLGLDEGTLVLFDRRPDAADIAERTGFSEATTPSGRRVRLLRA